MDDEGVTYFLTILFEYPLEGEGGDSERLFAILRKKMIILFFTHIIAFPFDTR